jgi:glyoxylase-like metal-dependent hydrolase (beta-lactamase superfamily II)/ferredoxin
VRDIARVDLRHPANREGAWFVDRRCIDCGTCRELAPRLFGALGEQSVVVGQPTGASEELDAWLAAQACPTQSIGTLDRRPRPGRLYPRELRPGSGVFDCGFTSPDSFGATSWFVRRDDGNVLVDSPRFTTGLAAAFDALGGIDHVALTHRDDVADADRWAETFGARVWIHAADAAAAPYATDRFDGLDEIAVTPSLLAVPVPGHTRGSTVFLLDGGDLFTGDSLAWSHEEHDLVAFRYACWYSWPAQSESLARLAAHHRFRSVLPGHGARVEGDPDELHARLLRLVARMRT